MPCDTKTLPGQTLTQRKAEVRGALDRLSQGLAAGRVKAVIGPQGAIAFAGWADADRGRVTDGCAYRLLMVTGSALAKAKVAQAEQLAGRTVNRQAAVHSHDGGRTFHPNHR